MTLPQLRDSDALLSKDVRDFFKRMFATTNEDEDPSDDQESKDNDDSSDDEAATEGDDFSELTFAVDDNVRVWWPNGGPSAWFDGVVEKVCTIMLKVNYPDTGDWQHHDPTKWKIEKR